MNDGQKTSKEGKYAKLENALRTLNSNVTAMSGKIETASTIHKQTAGLSVMLHSLCYAQKKSSEKQG